jgi:hypothetical protein
MASKQQQKLFDAITKWIPNYHFIQDYRPDFLKNPKTGKNLEIDIYCEEKKFGFEYQGAHHFDSIDFSNPDKSRENDFKKQLLVEKLQSRILIIEIFEEDLFGNIIQNVAKRIYNTSLMYKERGVLNNYRILFNIYLGMKYSIGHGFTFSLSKFAILDENGNHYKHPEECGKEFNDVKGFFKSRKKDNAERNEKIKEQKIKNAKASGYLHWLKKKIESININRKS